MFKNAETISFAQNRIPQKIVELLGFVKMCMHM